MQGKNQRRFACRKFFLTESLTHPGREKGEALGWEPKNDNLMGRRAKGFSLFFVTKKGRSRTYIPTGRDWKLYLEGKFASWSGLVMTDFAVEVKCALKDVEKCRRAFEKQGWRRGGVMLCFTTFL